jgi:hypothetical protein
MLHQLKVLFKLGFLQKRFGIRPSGRSAFQTQPTWHKLAGAGEDLDGDTVAGEMVGDGEDLDGDGAMMAGDTVVGVVAGEEAEDLGILSLTKTTHQQQTSAVLPPPISIPRLPLHQPFTLEF